MNTEIIQTNQETKAKNTLEDFKKLPKDIHISTMTVTCCFQTKFKIANIRNYMDSLKKEELVDDSSVHKKKKKNRKPRKEKEVEKEFRNQISKQITTTKIKNTLSVKFFKSGSIHMTGCKGAENFTDVMTIICEEFSKIKGVYDPTTNTIKEIKFVKNPEMLKLENIKNIKVEMINSNFALNFKINRDRLYKLLLTQNVDCGFEPCAHAGVNIKFHYNERYTVSIFVFESGSIIITGARKVKHIAAAYKFIITKIYENYNLIVLSQIELSSSIKKIKEKRLLENKSVKI